MGAEPGSKVDATFANEVVEPKPQKPTTITVREAIAKLANMEDMDAEVCFTFHNSDPIPITDIADNGTGQVVLSS